MLTRPTAVASAADDDKAKAPQASQPTAGERLRAAREKCDMSIRDAASQLHLDHWMVKALENDDFAALGAPVFAKGHMRTYALLLGLDPDDLMIAYYEAQGASEAPPIVGKAMRAEGRRAQIPWASMAVGLLIIAIAALVAWWFLVREPVVADGNEAASNAPDERVVSRQAPLPAMSAAAASRKEPAPASPVAVEATLAAPAASIAQVAARNEPPATSALADEPAAELPVQSARPEPAPPALAPGQVHVRLEFRGDSWVEVHDATDTRLLWDLRRRGAVEELRGQAPIEVFLGRAADVAVEVNGEPFTIPAGARRRDTARFRITAP